MDELDKKAEVKKKKDFIGNKKMIRKNIISSSTVFKKKLLGKYVLYIFDDNSYIEVFYRKSCFSHLTGVKTSLNAYDFYTKAISRELSFSQFSFDKKSHPYDLAKKKTSRLEEIDKFISSKLCALKDVTTGSMEFKFALTDSDLTLCFSENFDKETNTKIDDYYIPASFRVGDDTVNKSKEKHEVTHIFTKKQKQIGYDVLCFGNVDNIEQFQDDVKDKIDITQISSQVESA